MTITSGEQRDQVALDNRGAEIIPQVRGRSAHVDYRHKARPRQYARLGPEPGE